MKLTVRRHKSTWAIYTCTGLELAHAESVSLADVDFIDGGAVGYVLAVWGCELTEAAHRVSGAIQALGIGRHFPQPRGIRIDYHGWRDMKTSVTVRRAPQVVLHQSCAYYTSKEQRNANREHSERYVESCLRVA